MSLGRSSSPPALLWPGLLLGAGLGGFVDGIVLHQVLQWHHMLSSTPEFPVTTVAGLQANTLGDGLFHTATWVAVAVGLALLWRLVTSRPGPWSGSALLGALLAGWGGFNLVEGVVNHHVLGIHHVRTDAGSVLAWDLGFLALGALLLAGGLALYGRGQRLRRDGITARPARPTG